MLATAVFTTTASVCSVCADTEQGATDTAKKIVFSDVNDTTVGVEAINKLVEAGIIKGYDDGSFRPDNSLSRAEAVTVIWNFYNLFE